MTKFKSYANKRNLLSSFQETDEDRCDVTMSTSPNTGVKRKRINPDWIVHLRA